MSAPKGESDYLVDKEAPKSKASLDTILIETIGQFGRYQLRILLLAVLLGIFTAFSALEYVFSTARSTTRCLIPECEDAGTADFAPSWIANSVPTSDGTFDNCVRLKPLNASSALFKADECPAEWFIPNATIPCTDFLYENTNTLVFAYELACDEWRRTFVGVAHTAGGLLALPITGFVSDRWGRRFALALNAVNTAWLGLARACCGSYYGFLVAELAKAMFGGGVFSCAYILVMELVGPKHRVAAGAALNTSISLGQFFLSLIARTLPHWKHLILSIYLPHFLFISYFWIMSESVRWYMSKGRYKEVEEIIKAVARKNNRQLTDTSLKAIKDCVEAEEKIKELNRRNERKEPWLILEVFRHKEILKRCFVSPIWWVTCTLVYYGMSINSVNMSGNRYTNLMVVAVSEIPGYWLAVLLMDRVGRKPVLIGAYWSCAACQLAFIYIPKHMYVVSILMYLVGKFSIAIVMMALYIYTAEIYPTKHRHSLLAYSSMIGRIGTIVAPLTPAFGAAIWHHFPSALFCGFAFVSGALVFLAPETVGSKLPDTMEEASMLGVKRNKQ